MAKKKKVTAAAKKRNKAARSANNNERKPLWVHSLDFLPLNQLENGSSSTKLRIISWNILAEAYTSVRSHPCLPSPYKNAVFDKSRRRALINKSLRRFCDMNVDIMCLQEVDLPLEILKERGYASILTPTTKGGGGGRVDACGIYYLKERWKLCEHELIRMDDLATLGQQLPSKNTKGESNLQSLSKSFLRRNVAVLCKLECKSSGARIVVANAHAYWNPEYEYVKLCQVHYVMKRAGEFASPEEGIVFCGDLNSQPGSFVHRYLTEGVLNAKQVAPWYRHFSQDDGGFEGNGNENSTENSSLKGENGNKQQDCVASTNGEENARNQLEKLKLADTDQEGETQIRYLCDFTLNRFTRWLRILGIDTALETEEEEKQRTQENNILLFERCKSEERTLVTTSTKLILRKDCPPGTYLVNPKSLVNLEAALVHLLLHHGVTLKPANFLSRCVVCNGNIEHVHGLGEKKRVFVSNNAPDLSNELDVYECNGCGQGYWWCDKPTSSASRVKNQATRLFELCLRGGVPIEGELRMFDFVNVQQERERGLQEDDIELEHLTVTDWLKDEKLSCPVPLESAYALRDKRDTILGERLAFTNVTSGFVGTLDYIFFDSRHFSATESLYVPTSFKELNGRELDRGHLLPSCDWPSDHLAIGVQLEPNMSAKIIDKTVLSEGQDTSVGEKASGENGTTTTTLLCEPTSGTSVPPPPLPTMHGPRCSCGCVPNILSMFEMAELRKQARLKKENAS